MLFAKFSASISSAFARNAPPKIILGLVISLCTIGLLIYSQTLAFVWDEGFHLLSAQLIINGKIPYIDYCFPQTPLNAYWNAAWMSLFGQDWHITHIPAALAVAGSVLLMAQWVFVRFPVDSWRLACAVITALLIACNTNVVQFGTIAQAYGIGMFLGSAAFRFAVAAVPQSSPWFAFFAGIAASSAAGCTLLTAPIVPVLLLWLWRYSLPATRPSKVIAFIAGCLPPFVPVLVLFVKAPRQTIFNVVRYQALLRRVNWSGATAHDFDVFTAWLQSTPAMLLLFLGVAGCLYLRRATTWDRLLRAEFALCAYLSLAVILYISTAHPTFQRYMIVAVPFCAAIATVGLYSLGTQLVANGSPRWPAILVSFLMLLSIGKDLFDDRESTHWSEYEQIARKIKDVTPPGGEIYADEHVYFLLRRTPPFGMEFSYSHKLNLPRKEELLYHVISEAALAEQVKQGKYATVENCKDDRIEELKLTDLYPHEADIGDCSIFWGKLKTKPAH